MGNGGIVIRNRMNNGTGRIYLVLIILVVIQGRQNGTDQLLSQWRLSMINFATAGSERLRMSNTGSFLVGTTSDGVGRFAFYNQQSSGGDSNNVKDMGLYVRNDCGPTDVDLLGVDNLTMKIHNGAYAGTIIANPQGTTYNTTSVIPWCFTQWME